MKQADFQDKEKETQDQRSQNSKIATEAFFIAIMGAFVLLEYGMIHNEMIYRFSCYVHAKSHQDLQVSWPWLTRADRMLVSPGSNRCIE